MAFRRADVPMPRWRVALIWLAIGAVLSGGGCSWAGWYGTSSRWRVVTYPQAGLDRLQLSFWMKWTVTVVRLRWSVRQKEPWCHLPR
jgi:hypothetical protein